MSATNDINFMDEEEFIKLPDIPEKWKIYELTKEEEKFINRGYCENEPIALQLKN